MSTTELIISNPWSGSSGGSLAAEQQQVVAANGTATFMDQIFQIASRELREDEVTRRQCLQQMRDWIKQNRDIQNCFTDDRFLVRFLRVKKFSIPMAEQVLLKYLNFRKRFKHIMYDMDCLDEKVNELVTNGYIFVSPFRDINGRRVILYNLSKFDPHKYTSTDMARAHAVTYETLLNDEENQILGVNHVGDIAGISPAIVTIWSITEFATLIRWGEQSFPMRHKEINLLNMPAGLKYVYDFAKSIVSEKLRDRFRIHDSLSDLHSKVNKRCLPLELGGIMPVKDMVVLWKEELAAKREVLLSYDCMNLLSDRDIIRRSNMPLPDSLGSIQGSFRKLELD